MLDSYHQNVILNGVDDLVSYAFRRGRVAECENAAVERDADFGDHKMAKYAVPSLDECPSCRKVERSSCEQALLCKGEFVYIGFQGRWREQVRLNLYRARFTLGK